MIAGRHPIDTLGAVVDLAVAVINRPAHVSRISEITDLALIVDSERARLAEGGALIRGEVAMLLDALMHIEAEREIGRGPAIGRATQWRMVAGALLPMVQENMADLIALPDARPSTTDHDFGRRR